MIGIGDRSRPLELRMTCGIEYSPIWADATFKDFPGLIDCFDDVVVDSIGLGTRDEVTEHDRLIDTSGICILEIVSCARPTELGDNNALAGVGLTELVVNQHGLVDSLRFREALPVGKNVRGNVVDRRNQFGVFDPYMPDFAGRHGDVRRALHPLDHLNEIRDLLLAAEDGLVADNNAVDIAMTLGEIDHRAYFTLVTILIFVDPCAGGDPQTEFSCYAGNKLHAAGRRIGANRPRERGQQFEIGTNLRDARLGAGVRMR